MSSEIRGDDGFKTSAGGIVLQTRYVVYKGTNQISTENVVPFPLDFLAVTITPKSDQSVFKLELAICHESSSTTNMHDMMFSANRNSTYLTPVIKSGQNGGIAPPNTGVRSSSDTTLDFAGYVFIDEPNTSSQIVYTPTIQTAEVQTIYINRTVIDSAVNYAERGMTTFIVTELSGT